MPRYALEVAYDGRNFHGFAKQKSVRTVQDEIEKALMKLYGKRIEVEYASRTDAGVHAIGQVVAFNADSKVEPRRLPDALNFYLPKEICITNACPVEDNFSPQKDAHHKLYRYIALEGGRLPPFLNGLCLPLESRLDVSAIDTVCGLLSGEHDFAPLLVKQKEGRETTVRLERVAVGRYSAFPAHSKRPLLNSVDTSSEGDFLLFELEAKRFLYKMVRSICGLLVQVGSGGLGASDVEAVLAGKRHWRVSPLPPDGLYLVRVCYGNSYGLCDNL